MKIIIVGSGKIGSTLAEQLLREGHQITLIDRNARILEQTTQKLDILCIEGNGATAETLKEAGVKNTDLLLALTDSDEVNLLCCLIGKKLGAKHTIARVRNPEYNNELSLITEDLGLSMSVNPELTCALEMARTLRTPSAIKAETFANGHAELLQLKLSPDSVLVGKTLAELPGIIPVRVLICAVERGDAVYIPSGTFCFAADDRISIIAGIHGGQAFFRRITPSAAPIRNVMLVGGGRLSYYLARQLLESGMEVSIIEQDRNRCEELSELLPKATVLHGDGGDEAFLLEAGLSHMDAFASLTGMDEENILLSLYVRRNYPKIKVLTKINRTSFHAIAGSMDVGSVYAPRESVSNLICRYARGMQNSLDSQIETLYKLVSGKVEALEFRVYAHAKVCGIPLHSLPLRKDLLIGCINRNGKIIIPSGQDMILPGDTVIIVTAKTGLNDLDEILEKRKG